RLRYRERARRGSGGGSGSHSRRRGLTPARRGGSCWWCRVGCSACRPRGGGARRTIELLELVELTDAADRPIKGYSGGMKRRLDLASALVHEPEALFLGEASAGRAA